MGGKHFKNRSFESDDNQGNKFDNTQRQNMTPNRSNEPEVTTPVEEVTVKFYNAEKGFGFVSTQKGDLFIHASVLRTVGRTTLEQNEKLMVHRGEGKQPGKEQVVKIVQ